MIECWVAAARQQHCFGAGAFSYEYIPNITQENTPINIHATKRHFLPRKFLIFENARGGTPYPPKKKSTPSPPPLIISACQTPGF